ALRSLLRLRAGRDRQPRRGVLLRPHRALPLSRAARAGYAELAGRLVTRAIALLTAQVLPVRAILRALLGLARPPPARADLTPRQGLTLAPHTRQVLERLHEPVTATAFTSGQEQGIRKEIEDLLTLYHDAQPLLTARLLDLDRSPGEADRLGVSNYNV